MAVAVWDDGVPAARTARRLACPHVATDPTGRVVQGLPLTFAFGGRLLYWRGPSPFYFVRVPDDVSAAIHAIAAAVTYGWGVIPVTVRIGKTEFETSLFPKDGRYLVPIKVAVRRAEQISDEATVELELSIRR